MSFYLNDIFWAFIFVLMTNFLYRIPLIMWLKMWKPLWSMKSFFSCIVKKTELNFLSLPHGHSGIGACGRGLKLPKFHFKNRKAHVNFCVLKKSVSLIPCIKNWYIQHQNNGTDKHYLNYRQEMHFANLRSFIFKIFRGTCHRTP